MQEHVLAQLADFLRVLHAFPPVDLPQRLPGSPSEGLVADTRTYWESMYAEVRQKLFPAMRADARRQITDHYEAYLDDTNLQRVYPCLRHGDFGGSNILWEPANGESLV